MTLKVIQIGRLNEIFVQLTMLRLPPKKAYALYSISKTIGEKFEFVANEQRKLVEEYGVSVSPEGYFNFEENPEKGAEFMAKLQELNDMEIDLDINPVILTENDTQGFTLTMAQVAALEGVVSFE